MSGRQLQASRQWSRGGSRNNNNNNKRKSKEFKFATQEQSQKGNYGTFNAVKEKIVIHIQKTYEFGRDIATAICDGKTFDPTTKRPTRNVYRITPSATETVEEKTNRLLRESDGQKAFDIEYDSELKHYLKRKYLYKENEAMAFALIVNDYCTTAMKNRIQEHPEYEKKLLDDPIKLLDAIRILTHNPLRAVYPIASGVDVLYRWYTLKQYAHENLTDYTKRFKHMRDIVVNQFGNNIFEHFIIRTDEYMNERDVDKKNEMKDGSFEQFAAYMLLKGSDKDKYDSLKETLVTSFSVKQDNYPRTIQDMVDTLSKHKFDDAYYMRQEKYKKEKRKNGKKKQNDKQNDNNDAEDDVNLAQFAQFGKNKKYQCYKCGGSDHAMSKCPRGKIPKSEWWVNCAIQAMQEQMMQEEENKSNDNDDDDDDDKEPDWSMLQCMPCTNQTETNLHTTNENKKIKLVLDTGSTINATIKDKEIVRNIRKSKNPIVMATNAGQKILSEDAELVGLGTVK